MDMGLGHVLPTQEMSASCFQLPLISFVDTRDVSGDWRDGWRRLAKQGGWHIVSPSKLGQLFGIACLTSGPTAQSRKDHCWELSQVFGDCCAERHDAMS